MIWVLVNWKRVPLFKSALPSERMAASIRSGLRYVRYAPNLQASLLRAFTFTFFFSAIWSLLAVVAHNDLHQGALGYGILNGSMGLGAVVAAFTLARVRRRFSTDTIIAVATLYSVVTLVVLARMHRPSIVIPVLMVAGFCWTSTMASLNTSVQMCVPAWVQARALGTYLMTLPGRAGAGVGAVGSDCRARGTSCPLLCAAGGFAGTYPLVRRFHILRGGIPDTTPHQLRRAAPELAPFPEGEEDDPAQAGPVRISIEYRIPVENYAEFTHGTPAARGAAARWRAALGHLSRCGGPGAAE